MRRRNWPIALAILFVAQLAWYLLYTRQIVQALRANAEGLSEVYAQVCPRLVAAGIACATTDYRLSPSFQWPTNSASVDPTRPTTATSHVADPSLILLSIAQPLVCIIRVQSVPSKAGCSLQQQNNVQLRVCHR